MKNIVRIKKVELKQIKNVNYGMVELHNTFSEDGYYKSDILGIYGQNGSGKTALVNSLNVLSLLWRGKALTANIKNLIQVDKNDLEINIEIAVENMKAYLIYYSVKLSKFDNGVIVDSEVLSYKELVDDSWSKKKVILEYDRNFKDLLKPKGNVKLIGGADRVVDIAVANKLAIANRSSFVFSEEFIKVAGANKKFGDFLDIIKSINYYAKNELLVDSLIEDQNNEYVELKIIGAENRLNIYQPSLVKDVDFLEVEKRIKKFNTVIEAIIPDLTIGIKDLGKELMSDGIVGRKVELVSKRGSFEFPLRNESEGIRKIISLIDSLILMYTFPSICLVIDELDAGVFEYLMGEILQIIEERGQGQLIFTSHNLRPLEVLETNSLVFTTTNPDNRYLRLEKDLDQNNLRDMYYRSINLGGLEEGVYSKTSSYDIARAFRKAGKEIYED